MFSIRNIVFILLFTVEFISAQTFSLPNEWKFRTGDNVEYKNPNFDDSGWENHLLPTNWDKYGYEKYDGFAWYRVSFDLPQNMQTQDLMLELGSIDDSDETYFNGQLIGKTGKFPPNDQSAWDKARNYTVPKSLLKTHNTIAIKIYDGNGGGGLYGGKMMLSYLVDFNKKREERLQNKSSYFQLTTSNGLISAVYNSEKDEIEAVYPHIFSAIDSAQYVKPFITNLKTNRTDKPISVQYKENTHVIEVKYSDGLTIDYFASFIENDKTFRIECSGNEKSLAELQFLYGFLNSQEKTSSISPEENKYIRFSFSIGCSRKNPENCEFAQGNSKYNDSEAQKEVAFMRSIINKAKIPENISKEEQDVMEQAVSILKMSQVSDKEIYPDSRGQVLASLRPGVWSISWVRDGSYALSAMSKLGMYEEARKGLEFMLKAPSNRFKNYIFRDGKNYGPEVDYQISLTRYFGNGKEECDFNENGPNIEYDDWGLFLIAFSDYVTESQDWEFFHKWQPVVQTKVADAIVHIIQPNGLLKRDSGPWEHHLPGRQYAFTQGVCSVGLNRFAQLLEHENIPSTTYTTASQTIYNGVMKNLLVNNEFIKCNAQDNSPSDHYYYDGATFELFASDFINDKNLFLSHMKVYDAQLKVNEKYGKDRGYIRFNSEDSYENQEWPFASMRVAIAQNKFGYPEKAKQLINRITEFAQQNYNQIPEIITNEEQQYSGAIPMVGYGSGAYVLTILDYYKNQK